MPAPADPYATVQTGDALAGGSGTAVIKAPVGINEPATPAEAPAPTGQPAMEGPMDQPAMAGGRGVDKVSMILAVVGLLIVIGMVVVLAMMDVG
jgi:hypothetical protein